jgi:hypothetical protein
LFHTAEDAARVSYLYYDQHFKLKLREANGQVRDFPTRRHNMMVTRRFTEMTSWLEARQLLFRQHCGDGELFWLPHAGAVHEAVTEALRQEPWLLVAPAARLASVGSAQTLDRA